VTYFGRVTIIDNIEKKLYVVVR